MESIENITESKKQYNSMVRDLKSDFFPLLEQIINKLTFKKIFYEKSESETEGNDDDASVFKNKYYFNSRYNREKNKNIIYEDLLTNTQIIVEGPVEFMNMFNDIYAVCDKNRVNRYFIAFVYSSKYTDMYISGMIIYFDIFNENKVIKKNIFNNILCDFDTRNGMINENSTVFYNQTLLFYQTHRDTYKLMLFINLLTYNDTLLNQAYHYNNDLELHFKRKLNTDDYTSRFLFGELNTRDISDNKKIVIFDLGSTKVEIKQNNPVLTNKSYSYVVIDSYKTTNKNYQEFIGELKKIPEEEYGDGYPDYCIKCCRLTMIGNYCYNWTSMGLGNSYCHNCEIKYSFSGKEWQCAKLNERNHICCKKLNEYYYCDGIHSTTEKIDMVDKVAREHGTNRSYKYPYKCNVNLTRVPC